MSRHDGIRDEGRIGGEVDTKCQQKEPFHWKCYDIGGWTSLFGFPLKEYGLPRWLSEKESACNAGDTGVSGSITGLGRYPGEGNGNPLQYSCLKNPLDQETWLTTVHGVCKEYTELDMTEWLSMIKKYQFSSVQSLCCVWLFATPWIAARQASLYITSSWSLLKLMSIESVMPYSHLILCHPLLLLPPILPSIGVFSNESTLRMRWPKHWSFSFSISLYRNRHILHFLARVNHPAKPLKVKWPLLKEKGKGVHPGQLAPRTWQWPAERAETDEETRSAESWGDLNLCETSPGISWKYLSRRLFWGLWSSVKRWDH